MDQIAIGVDIGGSHISCAAVNINERKILSDTFSEGAVDCHASSAEIIRVWGDTITKTLDRLERNSVAGIGVAMPGPFDYQKGIALFGRETRKFEKIYGMDIGLAIRSYLRLPEAVSIRFVNDAAAFAMGEAWAGKAAGKKKSVSITLGTGLGSGFIDDGFPVFTGPSVPEDGFIYHLPFKDSIADDYFSTRGLIEKYASITGRKLKGVKEIAKEAPQNPDALKVFEEFGAELAGLLSPWVERFGAQVLVVGGSISKAFDLFGPSMLKAFNNKNGNLVVEKSELNDHAQILGGARLANDELWKKIVSNQGK
jgi:glucokinase